MFYLTQGVSGIQALYLISFTVNLFFCLKLTLKKEILHYQKSTKMLIYKIECS